MLIYVCLKHAGNLTKKMKQVPFYLDQPPQTLRELIAGAVHTCLTDAKKRTEIGELPTPLRDEEMDGMREVGKFAFGVLYNRNETDEATAVGTAVDAVQDGLVRIFRGTEELCELDVPIDIREGDVFTFVRLTMLSGRMW